MKKIGFFSVLVLFISLLTACVPSENDEVYRETKFLFDTEVYIEAYGSDAEKAGKKAMKKMATIDQRANFYSVDSEITLLNGSAGKKPVPLSEDTFELLERALEIAELTNGAFEPTIGPLVQRWQRAKTDEELPSSVEIENLLQLIDYKKVVLDSDHLTAYLPEADMSIDLGAIAKGFAVEKGMKILMKAGIDSAMVRSGGNVYTIGEKPDGTSWRVGIRNPLQLDEKIGYVEPQNQVVDTSGNYEQSFKINGKEYGHIINPRTGYPAEGTASSTIIANSPSLADALSTAVFILGPEKGIALIEEIPETEVYIIDSNGSRYISSRFEGLHE